MLASAITRSAATPQRPLGADPTTSLPAATSFHSASGLMAPGSTQARPTTAMGAKEEGDSDDNFYA